MKGFIFTLILLSTLSSCKKYDKNGREIKDYDELDKASWLLGNWQTVRPDGNLQEIWTIKNDSTFSGQSYFINKNDTIHYETIDLLENQGKLFYLATVIGENQDLPVTFNYKETEENLLQFENPKHDYPSKILYKLKDTLNIELIISGKQMGKNSTESYKLNKIK